MKMPKFFRISFLNIDLLLRDKLLAGGMEVANAGEGKGPDTWAAQIIGDQVPRAVHIREVTRVDEPFLPFFSKSPAPRSASTGIVF